MGVITLKVLAFLKSYWYIPVIGLCALILVFVFKSNKIDFWNILEKSIESHKNQLKQIEKIEKKLEDQKEQLNRENEQIVSHIEAEFIKNQQKLNEEKRVEILKTVQKYKDNPEKIAELLSKRYGFKIVPPLD